LATSHEVRTFHECVPCGAPAGHLFDDSICEEFTDCGPNEFAINSGPCAEQQLGFAHGATLQAQQHDLSLGHGYDSVGAAAAAARRFSQLRRTPSEIFLLCSSDFGLSKFPRRPGRTRWRIDLSLRRAACTKRKPADAKVNSK
jgi:hypothetical protein